MSLSLFPWFLQMTDLTPPSLIDPLAPDWAPCSMTFHHNPLSTHPALLIKCPLLK